MAAETACIRLCPHGLRFDSLPCGSNRLYPWAYALFGGKVQCV